MQLLSTFLYRNIAWIVHPFVGNSDKTVKSVDTATIGRGETHRSEIVGCPVLTMQETANLVVRGSCESAGHFLPMADHVNSSTSVGREFFAYPSVHSRLSCQKPRSSS